MGTKFNEVEDVPCEDFLQALQKGGYHGVPGSLKFPARLSVKSLKEEALVVVFCAWKVAAHWMVSWSSFNVAMLLSLISK